MKVREVIELLKSYPQDARMVAPGYEGGFDEVLGAEEIRIRPNSNSDWFYGIHAEAEGAQRTNERVEQAVALVLSRRYGEEH